MKDENIALPNFDDTDLIPKSLLVGWMIGNGYTLPWNPTLAQVFRAIKNMGERMKEQTQTPPVPTALENQTQETTMNLNNLDFSAFTRDELRELFDIAVEQVMQSTGCDYAKAVTRASLLNKPLVAAMKAKLDEPPPRDPALGNALPPKPIFSPQLCLLFGIPAAAGKDDELTSMLWRVVRGNTTDMDFAALFNNTVALVEVREKVSKDLADVFVRRDYPELARRADAAKGQEAAK